MYAKIQKYDSGNNIIVFKGEEDPISKGSKVEFLKGSDCPNGEAICTSIKLPSSIGFKNIEEDSGIKSFVIHIEDFSEEVKLGYSRVNI